MISTAVPSGSATKNMRTPPTSKGSWSGRIPAATSSVVDAQGDVRVAERGARAALASLAAVSEAEQLEGHAAGARHLETHHPALRSRLPGGGLHAGPVEPVIEDHVEAETVPIEHE